MHGRISFQHDRKTKLAVVGRLTKRHEEAENGAAGWRMADASKDYLDMMLDNIVAFRIEIARVLAKSKLNQNRADADFNAVAEQMAGYGKVGLAARMKELGKNR